MINRKASVPHEENLIRELRDDPEFCAEYLKAAIEDTDEPKVLLIALRHVAEACMPATACDELQQT
jgi:DNA-binding phage protein